MNLGALGSIAGGISSGLSNGQKFEEGIRKAQLEKLQRAAETSAGNAMFGGDVGGLSNLDQSQAPPPQQMMPGQPSQPLQQPPTAQFGQPRMGTPGAPSPGVSAGPYAGAISGIESRGSGDYKAMGPVTRTGDRAYGKYGVMGANIPQWTKEVLGQSMTPQQFVASPQAQDAVFKAKFGGLVQRYGNPQDAASAWFTGKPQAQGANRADVNGMTGSNYVQKFNQGMGQGAPPQGQQQPPAQGGQQQPLSQASPQLQQMVQRIKQQNPGAPPAQMFRALQQLMPFLKQEDQQVIREQGLQMREALARQHDELTRFLEGGRNARQDQSQQGQNQRQDSREAAQDQRFTQGQQGQDSRLQQREAGQDQRQGQALTSREGIAGRSADERERHDKAGEATGAGRLALAGQGQEQRSAQATQRLKQSQQRLDMLKDNAQRASDTASRAFWQKKLEAEQKNYTALRNAEANVGRSGLAQPKIDAAVGDIEKKLGGDDKPRSEDAPPPAAQEASPPPEALKALQEGHETTFKNGQVWTIKDGKPSRVK